MSPDELAAVPEHMREDAEFYEHWAPEYYEEAECRNCGKPIYRYQMDLIVEWRHFNHAVYCVNLRAEPKDL
ncbi:hypothetical protein [Mycobacterium avium]|uniref:hypothetical protein n=1 Tax=Mycobacterium avium TaxID=1764 RepID=UPI0007A00264|nr:hypothetical protein [Mycobacterium avium]